MLHTCLQFCFTAFSTCFGMFFRILEPLGDGISGVAVFSSIFLGLFAINKFIDLFVFNIIYSPSSGDAQINAGFSDGKRSVTSNNRQPKGKGKQ